MNSDDPLHRNSKQLLRDEIPEAIASLDAEELAALNAAWDILAHPHQLPPALGNNGEPWTTWLLIGGRGAGKTRAGAEWIKGLANAPRQEDETERRIALIGETEHETREVMIEGVSGLLAVHPHDARPLWSPARRRLEWNNGAIAQAFSAEDPESLRGPQFSAAWADELAKWRHAEATFDMLQFGLRLGARPRQVITTTPRPIALLKRLITDPTSAVTHAATRANAYYLSPAFIDTVVKRYDGTRLGRQELDGEIIDERPDALWSRGGIESCRVAEAPALQRIIVAVDPPVSASKGADACGLVAAGRNENDIIYVIADETVSGLSPAGWAAKAIALWRRLEADALVVEVNQGGDMVRSVIREVDGSVPVIAVRAHRGKWLRAEPIAALYEQGRVKHAGVFPALEDEMCDFGLDGLSSGRSPDRLDAMVWAVAHLTFGGRGGPRVRGL
ncbi:DNA-packaging protein [Pseudorhodoplanes sinuspersici]|uniref:ATP-binding protein n=1 Tax=Pseudorhodoplanes sinuspersici TaxID=1235591 RepID=A0A1W6ZUE0_9HYPH|nr:terminase family protein [Pseudorhodoplanes sinuspersici]ARQ00933.1 ATP-binding protein [Pseudorhodoplanes sinuspersici]